MESFRDKLLFTQDWPKQGVNFADIASLLAEPMFSTHFVDYVEDYVSPLAIDYVVGLEARGFVGASWLSHHFQKPLVLVRKGGKLPPPVLSVDFETEYSTATFEISADVDIKGKTFHIHDDVLATGGTVNAVVSLIERLGGTVHSASFLIELESLGGRKKLGSGLYVSALKYN